VVPARLRGLAEQARGLALLTYGALRYARLVATNTGKRVLGMTSASPTKELDEALDAGFDFAIRIKRALSASGPGGTTVTLDELMSTVTDGAVKESIREFWDAITAITAGERPEVAELARTVIGAVMDLLGTVRDALADDGRVTADELLHGITDGGIRDELSRAIEGLDKIPGELQGMDMWKMIALVQRISAKLPALLGSA
jgi:hypothetical protein